MELSHFLSCQYLKIGWIFWCPYLEIKACMFRAKTNKWSFSEGPTAFGGNLTFTLKSEKEVATRNAFEGVEVGYLLLSRIWELQLLLRLRVQILFTFE